MADLDEIIKRNSNVPIEEFFKLLRDPEVFEAFQNDVVTSINEELVAELKQLDLRQPK